MASAEETPVSMLCGRCECDLTEEYEQEKTVTCDYCYETFCVRCWQDGYFHFSDDGELSVCEDCYPNALETGVTFDD